MTAVSSSCFWLFQCGEPPRQAPPSHGCTSFAEDQAIDLVGRVGEADRDAARTDADGADKQPHPILLPGKHLSDAGTHDGAFRIGPGGARPPAWRRRSAAYCQVAPLTRRSPCSVPPGSAPCKRHRVVIRSAALRHVTVCRHLLQRRPEYPEIHDPHHHLRRVATVRQPHPLFR